MRDTQRNIAYIYLRVSTEEQSISGLGLEAQEAACRDLASGLGISSVVCYPADTLSGATEIEDRPGLSNILLEIKKGDVLLVAKRDRIAREPRLIGFVEWTLTKRKATLYSAAGEGSGLAVDDVSGIMQRGMFDLFAKIERAMIRTRTRDALQAKKSRGERIGSVAYGYQLTADGLHVLDKKKLPKCRGAEPNPLPVCKGCLNLEPNPEEQAIIEIIRDLARKVSSRALTVRLNNAGVRTRTGNPWSKTQVLRILKRFSIL